MSFRAVLITSLLVLPCLAAEPAVDAKDLPRVPPTEPADVLKTFRIKKGFRVELAAAEPHVVDPIAMCFDEDGRLFVVEMRDYSERRDERLGRIKLLEDADNDGRFEKATVYADGLPWPTALFSYGGGLFVGCTPDVLFLRDADGDGVADEKHVIFTGFGSSVQRLNVQALLNSFTWGLDNRIYGLTSFNGGTITSPLDPDAKPLDLRSRNFSFDPRIIKRLNDPRRRSAGGAPFIRAESGGGQHGMSFDDFGRWFVCSNSAHLQMIMYDLRFAARNPHYAMPDPLVSIAVDGPAAEVFRISPDEPWRVIRTKWRVAGLVTGPVEGGGRASGYFTGATGVTIYRGNAFPSEFVGSAFVGDAGGNLVHRKLISYEENGRSLVQPVARRPADEARVEFLASTDNWFRPVQFANAPDGCLYVADMYREVIEHPWSLPESIKKHLDLNSGNDRGRIYRVVPEGFQRPDATKLGNAGTAELVATLQHPNGWHRDTAARLLYERNDPAAAAAMETLLRTSDSPVGRVHALHALGGLGKLESTHVTRALADPDARVRERAVALAGRLPQRPLKLLASMHDDPAARVRFRVALALGDDDDDDDDGHAAELAEIAGAGLGDPWTRAAVLSSLTKQAHDVLTMMMPLRHVRESPAGREFLHGLVRIMVGVGRRNEALALIAKLGDDPALQFTLAHPVVGTVGGGKLDGTFADALTTLRTKALRAAQDGRSPTDVRLAAIRLLSLGAYDDVAVTLLSLLNQQEPEAIRLAALGAIDRFHEPGLAEELLGRWNTFTPRVRSEALNVLLRRPERAKILVKAIESRVVRRAELSSNQIKFLREHQDGGVRELAGRVLPDAAASSTRQQVIDAKRGALDLNGDPQRGRAIFLERCASCHRLGGEGHALGPDLVTVKAAGREKMLANILDPNREVQPNYVAYLVETKSGDSHLGLVQSDTAAGVTVRQAYGVEAVIPRAQIKRLRSQEQSLMPEGLEDGLTAQGLADLLEFISTAEAER